uniref:Uncharacterized protein n=1 Tax=Magallana gigas TaxID=29159 RepID=A0A8W8NJV5_MAGGI
MCRPESVHSGRKESTTELRNGSPNIQRDQKEQKSTKDAATTEKQRLKKVLKDMDAYKLSLTGLVLIICSFIFQLIGLASPYWISFEYQGIKVHSGLWKTCATIKLIDKVECFDFESVSDWFKAVRATSIMGFISL